MVSCSEGLRSRRPVQMASVPGPPAQKSLLFGGCPVQRASSSECLGSRAACSEGLLSRGSLVQRASSRGAFCSWASCSEGLLSECLLFRGSPVQRASFSEGLRSRGPPAQRVCCSDGLRSTRPVQRCRLLIGPPVKVPPFQRDLFRGPPVQEAACLEKVSSASHI